MKKHLISFLLTLVALCGAANAQEVSGLQIGYCEGNVCTTGQNAFSNTADDQYISGAIYLPASKLALYDGCRIEKIHAGMASVLNIDELQVWVRESLEGENLADATITKQTTPKLAKGWNTVTLDNPYTISKDCEGLYVGYTFHQTGASVGLSVLTPDVCPTNENGLFVKLGTDAEWTDRHEEGTLAIEALVFGESLPQYNLVLKSMTLDPTYVIDKGSLSGSVTVANEAATTITGFDIQCSVDGITEFYTVPVECNIAYKEEGTFDFTINPAIDTDVPDYRTLTVTITNLKEGNDQDDSDNTLMQEFEVVRHDFARNVLIEEFTTEKCPNCPRVASYMHEFLEDEEIDARVNVLCHHSAYYTDWLTIQADIAYEWLFNLPTGTFAPALMMDRACTNYLSNHADNSPIYSPSSVTQMKDYAKRRMKEVAYVCVNVEAELVDGLVKVKVNGERIKDFTANPARIVVALVEDNIRARGQAGSDSSFTHQHVNRAYNSTWGDVIEWNGNEYEYECTFNLDTRYKKENLVVVAYVWDYDSTDVANCEISNSGRVRYADMTDNTSGVESIFAGEGTEQYYTIDGLRLSEPQNGLNIVRRADGTVVKRFVRK